MKAAGQSFNARAFTWFRLVLVLGSVWGGWGCKPKIGEDCATSIDCSISSDRLCDVTQPGGYCTVFNCEPNNCPDEAVCVAFGESTCSTAAVSTRFRRTFCMRSCEEDDDCRGGSYGCIDISRDPSRQIVDSNPSSRRICAVRVTDPASSQPPAANMTFPDPPICYPSDASFDVSRPEAGPGSRDVLAEREAPESSMPDSPGDRGDSADARGDATADGRGDAPDVGADSDAAGDASDGEGGNEAAAGDATDSNPAETGADAPDTDAASDDAPDTASDDAPDTDAASDDASGPDASGDSAAD